MAVMRLPCSLDPDEPDVEGVDRSRDETDEWEEEVDPKVDSETFDEPDADGWKEEGEDGAYDLGCGVFAHFAWNGRMES
jgi:hypothetical protein